MKHHLEYRSKVHSHMLSLALAASLTLPLPALAASITLATSPLATSTTTSVKPNLVMMLDNSGSMDWDHMPDDASDAGSAVTFIYGYYGIRSSQCNEVYYDPTITYQPPVHADGTNYADASFTAACDNGFSGACNVNLNTSFKASQYMLADTTAQSAYYYSYSGTQTTQLQKNYNSTINTFFAECSNNTAPGITIVAQNSSINSPSPSNPNGTATGTAPTSGVGGVFNKRRLATAETTTITVSGSSATTVSSITVNGVELMSATSASGGTSSITTATNIAANITLNGFSATALGSTITVTGPTSAANYTPVITQSGTMTLTPDVFPDTTAAKLTNFANWYSYYRTRLLMMKTAAGRAFSTITNNYRVGFMKFSSSTTPTVYVDTFCDNTTTGCDAVGTQRTDWYNALYNTTASGSTPTRTALSNVGRYFAAKLYTIDSTHPDPMQYSCQQNFSILSTDGYWNTGDGKMLNGTTVMDNEDGTAARPMKDDSQTNSTTVTQYTQNRYQGTATRIGGTTSNNCATGKQRLQVRQETRSCSVTTPPGGAGTCTAWSNGAWAYVSPYTNSSTTCVATATVTASIPNPNPTTAVVTGTPVTTTGSSGGTSNTLADAAMYYYQTDLRTGTFGVANVTGTLNNCTGAIAGVDVCTNNVFSSATDNQTQQHMTTFTLGLGASGWMNYSSSYLSDSTGSTTPPCDSAPDYVAVKLGCPAKSTVTPPVCSWQADGTTCNWPIPGLTGNDGFIANVDDLWHAAVNGHGAYFSATNPTTLAAGLGNALSSISAKKGSAAAAATSTLNPVAGNNFAYVASYTTVAWKGNLESRGINVATGMVDVNASWCVENVVADTCPAPSTVIIDNTGYSSTAYCVTTPATICTGGTMVNGNECHVPVATDCTGTMNSKASLTSDTRSIFTAPTVGLTPLAGQNLVPFDAAYATANPTNFAAAHISTLSQWTALTGPSTTAGTQQNLAQGVNLVNFLRGQHGFEDRTTNAVANRLYRYREAVMGDALESQPAFISSPVFSYPYPGYSAFKTAQASRAGMVYIGANDGMMHAFNALDGTGAASPCVIGAGVPCGGEEAWAYVPSMVIPNMWILADTSYATMHRNFVNGSPITSDVCTANCTDAATAVWKTILVAGLNGGGRGYYALDITNPSTPVLLWEFTTTAGIGAIQDDDVGYSYGQPVITKKNDGTWVVLVTSGYNNTSPGTGKGYLYVLNAGTGAIISKISTGVGSTSAIAGVCTGAPCPSGLAKIAGWNDEVTGNKVGYVYGGDLFGNLWRFDINSSVTATTGTGDVLKFATLFSDAAGNNPQPITTTPVLGLVNSKHYVFISTGKYLETGDLTTTQKQSLYSIKDDNATSTFVNPRNTLTPQTLSPNPDGTATRVSTSNSVTPGGPGCYADYPDSGERANIDSRLIQGILIAPTIVPSNTACSPGGYGWLNYFNYQTCGAIAVKSDSTIVGVNVIYIQGKPEVEIVTSTNPTPVKPSIQPTFVPTPASFSSHRTIWRELIP